MSYELQLLGRFQLLGPEGAPVVVRRPVQRLLAYLTLRGRREQRPLAASALWPELSDKRALANLRSVLWRCNQELPGLLGADDVALWLDQAVRVDYLDGRDPDSWFHDLLPGWTEDWIGLPQFLHRQTRLQLIEERARWYLRHGDLDDAEWLLARLMDQEPDRESARVLCELAAKSVDMKHTPPETP